MIKVKYTCGNYVWTGEPPFAEEPPICDAEGEAWLDFSKKQWHTFFGWMKCPECGVALYQIDGNLVEIE